MSFIIEDENLIHQLVKLSQTPLPPQPSPKQFIDIAKELVKNLQTELSGETIFTAERDNADLSQAHIVNVNDLLFFLNYNEIKANGKSLVFKAQNFDLKNLGDDGKLYVAYPTQGEAMYYIYRDGLARYLEDLKSKVTDNPIFTAMLVKLTNKINAELPLPKRPETQVAPSTPPQSVKPEKEGEPSSSGSTGQVTQQTLQQMALALPLDANDIDFVRINNFFMLFKQLLANSNNPRASDINQTMYDVQTKMNFVSTDQTRTPLQQFNLYSDPEAIVNILKPPVAGRYVPFLHNLQFIVDGAARVVDAFYAMYARQIPGEENRPVFTPNQRSLIEAQSRGGDSYVMRNKESLQSLINRYKEL
jgi:hypothetical protein